MTFNSEPSGDFEPGTVMAKLRKGFLWVGGIMIVLGMTALFVPLFSSLFVEILIGWLLTVSGCITVFGAFSLRGTGPFWWQFLMGLITLVGGLLLVLFPLQGLVALTVLLAVILLVTGAAQTMFALWMRPFPGWGWALASAAVSLFLGTFIMIALAEASAVILGFLLGIDLVSTGTVMIVLGRSLPQEPAH